MAFGPTGQKQRRGKRISVGRWHRDIVDENVVQPRVGHRLLNLRFGRRHNKSGFGFCRKGLSGLPEISLAVGPRPVYNPALTIACKLRFLLRS